MISSKAKKKLIVGLIIVLLVGSISGCRNYEKQGAVPVNQKKSQDEIQNANQDLNQDLNQAANQDLNHDENQNANQDENQDAAQEKQNTIQEKTDNTEKNNNVLSQEDMEVIHRLGYYSCDINSNEEYTDLLERIRDNNEIKELSISINNKIDGFLPKDFASLPSLESIQIMTMCSLADKMDYLPWFEQMDYDLEIIWHKDSFYYDSDEQLPLLLNLKELPYYNQLDFQSEDYLEVYNKRIHGGKSYQVFTFLNKKFDYFNNDLGRTTLLIGEIGAKTETQCIKVETPPYIDQSLGEYNSHAMHFEDLNFDGYEDMYMDILISGGKGYKCYYAFIWDPQKEKYIQDKTFTCFWFNHGYFAVDNENKRIIHGKDMTASDSYYGIIEYQNGQFMETKSLEVSVIGNADTIIPDYNGFVTVYEYRVKDELKKTLYKKGEEELSEKDIRDNFPEFQFVMEYRSVG